MRRVDRRRSGAVTSGLGTGWRTVLTDLSLILFMVTASVLPEQNGAKGAEPAPAKPAAAPAERSQPVAVWRPGKGAPSLSRWLAGADGRALVSLRVTYRSDRRGAVAGALALSQEAGNRPVRVLVEPGTTDSAEATLAYDTPAADAVVARPLQRR